MNTSYRIDSISTLDDTEHKKFDPQERRKNDADSWTRQSISFSLAWVQNLLICCTLIVAATNFNCVRGYNEENLGSLCARHKHEAPFRVETKTDSLVRQEISWKLIDITNTRKYTNNQVTTNYDLSFPVITFPSQKFDCGSTAEMIHTCIERTHHCIEKKRCYQFVMYDSKVNGPGSKVGSHHYKVFFNHKIVAKGGYFERYKRSNPFGDGCEQFDKNHWNISPEPTDDGILYGVSTKSLFMLKSVVTGKTSNLDTERSIVSSSRVNKRKLHLTLSRSASPFTVLEELFPVGKITKKSHLASVIPLHRKMLQQDGENNKNEESVLGSVELSRNPASSSHPTSSPSSDISGKPSSSPTRGRKTTNSPTISSKPTSSSIPTSFPSSEETNKSFIGIDDYNRRYFPRRQQDNHLRNKFSYPSIPSCTLSDRTRSAGCVTIPMNEVHVPDWVGQTYFKPPQCSNISSQYETNDNMKCNLGIPLPKVGAYSESFKEHESYGKVFNDGSLTNMPGPYPGNDLYTAVADMNNDGYIDIVIGNSDKNSRVVLNNGHGLFIDPPILIYTLGNYLMTCIALADMNNDGYVDVVIGNKGLGNSLVMNNGDETFVDPPITLPGGELSTKSIALADMNNDGYIDIVVGNDKESNHVLINNGNGVMNDFPIQLPGGNGSTRSIALADMNNDGYIDIIIGTPYDKMNKIVMNNGNGTFVDPVSLPAGDVNEPNNVKYIALADMNNDGYVDIVIGGYTFNQVVINNGNGTFIDPPIKLPGGDLTQADIALADMNNDGFIDVVIASKELGINLAMNNGDSTFRNNLISLPSNEVHKFSSISLADVNNDGRVDVIAANLEGRVNQVIVQNDNYGLFTPVLLPGGKYSTKSIAVADINNDGYLDIVLGNYKAQPNQLLMNNGDSTFAVYSIDILGDELSTYLVTLADMNNDGYVDLVIGNTEASMNQMLMNNRNGTFSNAPIPLPGATHFIALADMNNDGYVDLVIGDDDGTWTCIFLVVMNNGDGTFADPPIAISCGNLPAQGFALADMNNDGNIDIVTGNAININVVLNNGDQTFSDVLIILPHGTRRATTTSIVLADLNNDGYIDIVSGYYYQGVNEIVMNNGNGTFLDPFPLHGSDQYQTYSIAVADMNNDGYVDIVIGSVFNNQPNLVLINNGDGTFADPPILLPDDEKHFTWSIAVADMDNDGYLDVIVGYGDQSLNGESNQLIFSKSCTDGGVQLHGKSWCYKCKPDYMGIANSVCKECLPDHVQEGDSNRCAPITTCPMLGFRDFGGNECASCPNGTYYNNRIERQESDPLTWLEPRCVSCLPGEYSDTEDIPAINDCFKCLPGSFQNQSGASNCIECADGFFQTDPGSDSCDPCSPGGFCNSRLSFNGGYQPCKAGTYNALSGQEKETACVECPQGTFSIEVGAVSIMNCSACPPGTSSDVPGQTQCKPCPLGSYQQGYNSTSCIPCGTGTYADKNGLEECIKCPYRLNSTVGSISCNFCGNGFYLNDTSATPSKIFQIPDKYCRFCPSETNCAPSTTLQTLNIPMNYWRDSKDTASLYRCDNEVCTGTTQEQRTFDSGTSMYCLDGHTGPLCEVCVQNSAKGAINYYFSRREGRCIDCPSFLHTMFRTSIIILFASVLVLARVAINRISPSTESNLSLQAKSKIVISFYQIVSALPVVYGLDLDSRLKGWFDLFNFVNFDIFMFPRSCVGSMRTYLIVNAIWPYIIIALATIVLGLFDKIRALLHRYEMGKSCFYRCPPNGTFIGKKIIFFTIVVFYFVLPTVSRSVFDAIKCRAFETNDGDVKNSRSYLLADLNIQCDKENKEFSKLSNLFWVFFTIWPILTPIMFLMLLLSIRPSVRRNSPTSLALACRFLWEDYDEGMMFWDVIDTIRKLFLTGLIMFIDTNEGSNKVLRLAVATVVSSFYLGMLAIARPYKRNDNFYLAFVSNFLLNCCFVMGIILRLCVGGEGNDGEAGKTCSKFVANSLDSYGASLVVVFLTSGMMGITLVFIAITSINAINAPVVRLKKSGQSPNLDMLASCNYHVFMSHVWATGKKSTHSISRKLQLFMPKLKVWLDVDSLEFIGRLEEYVEESAVFVLFYSEGYFRSKNCRKEIYAAVQMEKPIILLHEGSEAVLDDLRDECETNCIDAPGSECILDHLFKSPPIQWLDEGAFSAAAMNRIYVSILSKLPRNSDLNDIQIRVPGEQGKVSLSRPLVVLVCNANIGALQVAEEVHALLPSRKTIEIRGIESVEDLPEFSKDIKIIANNDIFGDNLLGSNSDMDAGTTIRGDGQNRATLLLYLNQDTFLDAENRVKDIVQVVKDVKIDVMLVHELDHEKGSCDFAQFFKQTPQMLIDHPYNIYHEIAVPLYARKEYRTISLRKIILRMEQVE